MKKHNAFSLTELLITFSIIIVLCTIALPGFSFINKQALQNDLETLHSTLSYLRQRSIAGNKKYELFFDIQNNNYFCNFSEKKTLKHQLSRCVNFGFLPNSMGPPSSLKTPIKNAITFPEKKVVFWPSGKISPGTAYLRTKEYMGAITCPISQVSYIRKYSSTHDFFSGS